MRTFTCLFLISASCLLAQEGANCREVGGGILTNFIDGTNTLGSATGDLAGGLGVSVLGQAPGPNNAIVLHVHHHWVAATGETIGFDNAYATLFPTSVPGLYAASYVEGVVLNGNGTGRYAGASGKISAFGAVTLNPTDVTKSQLTLRYSGEVCLPGGSRRVQ
jgi:hypothetical protein